MRDKKRTIKMFPVSSALIDAMSQNALVAFVIEQGRSRLSARNMRWTVLVGTVKEGLYCVHR